MIRSKNRPSGDSSGWDAICRPAPAVPTFAPDDESSACPGILDLLMVNRVAGHMGQGPGGRLGHRVRDHQGHQDHNRAHKGWGPWDRARGRVSVHLDLRGLGVRSPLGRGPSSARDLAIDQEAVLAGTPGPARDPATALAPRLAGGLAPGQGLDPSADPVFVPDSVVVPGPGIGQGPDLAVGPGPDLGLAWDPDPASRPGPVRAAPKRPRPRRESKPSKRQPLPSVTLSSAYCPPAGDPGLWIETCLG